MNPFFRLHLLLFPPACRLCRRLMNPLARITPGFPFLCESCRAALPWKDPRYSCRACGAHTAEPERLRCVSCADREQHVTRVWCAFHYDAHVRQWILQLKYGREEALAPMLGALLDQAPGGGPPMDAFDLVLPVPLHRKRLRRRGFNQAYLLAHAWARSAGGNGGAARGPSTGVLQRHRNTRPQVELAPRERAANVAAAFSLVPAEGAPQREAAEPARAQADLAGSRVLLVDDLMTTGATLNACARTLLDAGAERVDAFVLARVK